MAQEKKTNRIKIKLNDINNLREILQEAYDQASSQIIQAQQEIAKLESSTNLAECCMDEKQKYAKAINDFLTIKDKAISKKTDITKQMSEILMKNNATTELSETAKPASFDFSKIREMLDGENSNETKKETIELKKTIKNKV